MKILFDATPNMQRSRSDARSMGPSKSSIPHHGYTSKQIWRRQLYVFKETVQHHDPKSILSKWVMSSIPFHMCLDTQPERLELLLAPALAHIAIGAKNAFTVRCTESGTFSTCTHEPGGGLDFIHGAGDDSRSMRTRHRAKRQRDHMKARTQESANTRSKTRQPKLASAAGVQEGQAASTPAGICNGGPKLPRPRKRRQ